MSALTVGNQYNVYFFDNEGSDRIEPEFAPIYNGLYVCVKRFTLFFEGKRYIPGSKADFAQMERLSDKVLIYVCEDTINHVVPIYENDYSSFSPLDVSKEENANLFDEYYLYAHCHIYEHETK
jgi:hypothetical protein